MSMMMSMKQTHSKYVFPAVVAVFGLIAVSASAAPLFDRTKNAPEDRAAMKEDMRATVDERKEEVKDRISEQFCERFGETFAKMAERMTEAENRLRERHENHAGEWEGRWNDQDGKLGELRTEQDARREEWYGKLDDLAETDEEREAVGVFRDAVDTAVDARRDAVDAAREAFQDAVEALSDDRQDDRDTLAARYREQVKAAVATAEAACENGDDMGEIRTQFRNALQSAHGALGEERDGSNGLGEEISKLAGIRNEAIRVAMEDFHDALDVAKADLREAFPESEE